LKSINVTNTAPRPRAALNQDCRVAIVRYLFMRRKLPEAITTWAQHWHLICVYACNNTKQALPVPHKTNI